MSVFDNLGSKISNFGGSLKQSASTFTGTMQLNSNIEKANKDLSDTYTTLGELFYNNSKGDVPKEYTEIFRRISDILGYIENTKQEIRKMTGVRQCPNCRADVQKGQLFCTSCGARVVEENQGGAVFCTNCGKEVQPGFAFCNYCGTRIQAQPMQQAPAFSSAPEANGYQPASAMNEGYQETVQNAAPNVNPYSFKAPTEEPAEVEETPEEVKTPAEAEAVNTPEEAEVEEAPAETASTQTAAPAADQAPVCPDCGASLRPGMSFCNMCGRKLG